jgi:alkanesulfonate monooxygenase SsuD/methylene tetrahydromethanopterin reductase-like flavin-dependent oxidoreductase (luciferase family)
MEIFSFHLMPWPHLPPDYDGSAWVTIPNSLYDPVLGGQLMGEYLDQLEYCETLGFDGVGLNEHHQTAWGLDASPNVTAGMLVRRTERLKILILGNALPLYSPPMRVAEELAMLDVVSGGRIIAGTVIGGAPEYYSSGMNPAEARARFGEAVDLLIQAWTRPGPFEFYGEYYKVPFANPWPRPLQQPHPPVWIPGTGSLETIQLCVDRGFTYSALPFFSREITEKSYASYRRLWLEAGKEADPSKLSVLLPIYVADSDQKARQEFEEHFWYFNKRLTRGVDSGAPGYMTPQSTARMLGAMNSFSTSASSWEDVEAAGYIMTGSPETVIEKLCERIEVTGAGNLLGMFQVGDMPHAKVMGNLDAFAEQVMPAIRKEFASGPRWAEEGR